MTSWKIIGLIATLVIILSIPGYLIKDKHFYRPLKSQPSATYAGSRKCMECHKDEYDRWKDSHHDRAMDMANDQTVLGDFNDRVVEFHGVTSRFYRQGEAYFVRTQGPEGRMGDFEITYTFGWYPLQQYLVPFAGGRLQCLPLAWDVPKGEWYHLYPHEPIDPGDWLYWTNAGQNWNGMCAECHSTDLKKNYDLHNDSYHTTWSEIDVSCEACHGPGSRHVQWAELPEMARPQTVNAELLVQTKGLDSRQQVELCAPCHSRRSILGDYTHAEADLLDTMLPSLLTPELYFVDGQIREEVYVYGSFIQSKMHQRNVRCSDCHDVHSLELIEEGNGLCLQCHRAAVYDSREHHFHKSKGEQGEPIVADDGTVLFEVGSGTECVRCHMPERPYMVIDDRADHSFRIPRADLSIILDTPNACRKCHIKETNQWADEHITEWYGPGRRAHYGRVLAGGRQGLEHALEDLINLASDPLYPVIVRATALSLLGAYPAEETSRAYELALMDDEALIRRTGVNNLMHPDPERQTALLAGMLFDPVKSVRIEAARRITQLADPRLDDSQNKAFQASLKDYEQAMEYSADFAFGRFNLANLYLSLGQQQRAVQNYQAALRIDELFHPAKINLALLFNQTGRKIEAESLLREVVTSSPEMSDVHYSLGLLLAEQGKYADSAHHLQLAASGMPEMARVHYNLGLLLQILNEQAGAETALRKARDLEPENLDYLYALTDHYLKRNNFKEARDLAEKMIAAHPDVPIGHDLLKLIEQHFEP